ncbi:TetR-like C-terminal domain-containing protein [Nonomuraea sp. NPDC046802]|uniref:TetR-like C-terminal domain-containing protein n=1 Tax=Nonomuraea sp. NPDC046802 TaxID=3154919 RepID=UPI0033D84B77
MTYERVASRAGTSKPVVYRRYGTRAALVLASLHAVLAEQRPMPSTGSLRDDLIARLEAAQARAAEIGETTYRAMLGEVDADLLDKIGALTGLAVAELERDVIAPARARGELGPEPLATNVLALPTILLRDRIVFGTATGSDATEIVDQICLPLFRRLSGDSPPLQSS